MENYQTPEGVRVPKALQPFMMGKEFIPYNPDKVAAWNAKVNGDTDAAKKGGKGKKQKGAAVNETTNKAKNAPAKGKAPAKIPAEAQKLFDECEAILKKSTYLTGANPTSKDKEMFLNIRPHQAHLSGRTHAYTMAWFGQVYRFSDQIKDKWPSAGGAAGGDDDMDLFGDDDEESAAAAKEAALAAKAKTKKVKPPEMSLIVLEVKPLDDTTNLDSMAEKIFSIKMDGLIWKTGGYKKEPVAFGIFKLIIGFSCEDSKVSVDDIQERIEALEDMVQSVEIASFTKI